MELDNKEDAPMPAYDTYRELLGLGAADVGALLLLAQRELLSGKADLAEETLGVLIDLDPFCRRAHQWMVLAKRALGKEDAARAHEDLLCGLMS